MEQASLFAQLGIDWKLLLSQAVNFFILLFVLQRFVYKPLMAVVKKRNTRIQEGLDKANEADVRLGEVDKISADRLKKTDEQSVAIIKDTQERARSLEDSLVKKAEAKGQDLMHQAEEIYKKQQEENTKKVLAQAGELVKKIVLKTVELRPEAIDQALIEKAITAIQHED